MKNFFMVLALCLTVSGVVWSVRSEADTNDEISRVQQEMLTFVRAAVMALNASPGDDGDGDGDYDEIERVMDNWRLRLQLSVGVGIPFFAKAEVVPEIEMVFIKTN